MASTAKNVVIVGGGIHGASIAYYLSKRSVPCTVIESVGVASAASGKSGGFLARVCMYFHFSHHASHI